jgi:cytochrome c biogenesis protein
MRVVRFVRLGWRRLTSMRTALVLLFLLALAAVPGSLLPQRPLNPDKVQTYITDHGAWGRFLDDVGAYDVFGSVWFTAIYLLLAVSLVGCLVPRIRVHVRALRRAPLPAPKNLAKLPEAGSFETGAAPGDAADTVRATLGRRWRVERREEAGGVVTLSAEKGYSRETANIVFHVALLASLVLIAIGKLFSYEGSLLLPVGSNFCNQISQYDSWKPGRFASEGKIHPAPFCLSLTNFSVKYSAQDEPTQFKAGIKYQPTLASPERAGTITVNHPLRLEGDRVYLIGHGYAPRVTITMPDGSVVHDVANFIPQDPSTYYSEGVFKEPGADGAKQDVGIQGSFAPTPAENAAGVITSVSPRVDHPALGLVVWLGDLNQTGLAESVYQLDTSKMKKIGVASLTEGQTHKFANGVTVRFDGYTQWVSLQVSHDPAQGYLLFSAVAMVVGLFGSLAVRRRRVWVRLSPARGGDDPSPTVVQVGGLARSDSGNFTTEFEALLERLRGAAAPASPDLVGAGKD